MNRLAGACVGRSHRSRTGKARLGELIERSRALLGMPADYRMAIVPASDTGAVEMAMWNLLGPRGVDVLVWESFGATWADDVTNHLKLADVRTLAAPYGDLPELSQVSPERDVVFAWNGTTSGVRVPDADWIADDRLGLVICDATSAAFAMDLPWSKLDVITYSWQKVLGGEGQHGVLILGPRAVERLESYKPPWPLPKIFRLTKGAKLIEGLFRGETINTPSMLCVEDALDGLAWAEHIGGVPALAARAEANLAAIEAWVADSDWIEFLARRKSIRSCTSVCFRIADRVLATIDGEAQNAIPKEVAAVLEAENVGYDIGGYRAAPPGLRIWAGPTVERHDLEVLFLWLDWAFAQVRPASAAA